MIAFADTPVAPALPPPGVSSRWRALLRHDRAARSAIAFLVALTLVALLAPWVAPYDPARQFDLVALKLQPPSAQHWFGTDLTSRDVLSRIIAGSRVSLSIAVLAVALTSLVGTTWGAVAGYTGGITDSVMMRVVDALLAIPRILLLLGIVALWGALSPTALILLLGLTGWFGVSRLVRAEVLLVREREFVSAARALGASASRIIVRHVIPQVLPPVIVAATLGLGNIIVIEAGLSFLGYGVPQPHASWGNILRDGREVIDRAWWLSVFPGVALAGTVLAINVVADRLRRALNPRQLPAP